MSPSRSAASDDEPMRYVMLGKDETSLEQKLEKYTGEVNWDYLKPHHRSGCLLYVDPELSLLEVGRAFADDDVQKVADWRASGDLVVPSQPHAEYWESAGLMFTALVVSPFVLMQPAPMSE